jgi:hypothetical protein
MYDEDFRCPKLDSTYSAESPAHDVTLAHREIVTPLVLLYLYIFLQFLI